MYNEDEQGKALKLMDEINLLAREEIKVEHKTTLLEKLREDFPDQKITCHQARVWAEQQQLNYQEVGAMCDELSIKITRCELGCF